MDVLKIIVVLAFLFMTINMIKPFIGSVTRKRAALYAAFWLILYLLVWGTPGFIHSSDEASGGSEGDVDQEVQQHEEEVSPQEKAEEAKLEEEIDFEPESIELIIDVPNLLGLSREEFVSKFGKELENNGEDPMVMTFEHGEVTFEDNVATSMTYYPEGLQYPEDNRMLLASLGFDIKELKKGSNPFESPVTFYLVGGFSDVTISAVEEKESGAPIDKIYMKKEIYRPTSPDEESKEEEDQN